MKNLHYELISKINLSHFLITSSFFLLTGLLTVNKILLLGILLLGISFVLFFMFFLEETKKIKLSKINTKRRIVYFSEESFYKNYKHVKNLKKEGFKVRTTLDKFYKEENSSDSIFIKNNKVKRFLNQEFHLNTIDGSRLSPVLE